MARDLIAVSTAGRDGAAVAYRADRNTLPFSAWNLASQRFQSNWVIKEHFGSRDVRGNH